MFLDFLDIFSLPLRDADVLGLDKTHKFAQKIARLGTVGRELSACK